MRKLTLMLFGCFLIWSSSPGEWLSRDYGYDLAGMVFAIGLLVTGITFISLVPEVKKEA